LNIVLADPTGFCFGVKRAITELEKALSVHGTIYSTGSPIHNPQEVRRLSKKGLVVVDDVSKIPDGARVFIRAHGESPDVLAGINQKSSTVIDGTCPFVKTAQNKARSLSSEGYFVIIIGNPEHPEVKGIRGFVNGDSIVVNDRSVIPEKMPSEKTGVVCQTTQRYELLADITSCIVYKCKELKVYNTICNATYERQKAIRELAKVVDGIIVIGGRNSANTSKLFQIARGESPAAVWIEEAAELQEEWLVTKENIGIAAGASTPDWLIEELKYKLKNTGSQRGWKR